MKNIKTFKEFVNEYKSYDNVINDSDENLKENMGSAGEYDPDDDVLDILKQAKFVDKYDSDEYDFEIDSSGNIVALSKEIAQDIAKELKKSGIRSTVKGNKVIAI